MGTLQDNGSLHRPSQLERNHILTDILDHIGEFASQYHLVDYDALKNEVLIPVLKGAFNPDTQLRGFLHAFRHTATFQRAFDDIGDGGFKAKIESFMDGKSSEDVVGQKDFHVGRHLSPQAKHHLSLIEELKKLFHNVVELKEAIEDIFHPKHVHVQDLPILWSNVAKTEPVEVYSNVRFQNWGQTVNNTPLYTFVPKSVWAVQNIVRHAKEKNLRVRCGGYRHSWSSIFSEDGGCFISLLDPVQVTTLPDPMSIEPGEFNSHGNELRTITLQEQTSADKRLCRIGVSVTNEDFRRWAVSNNAWTLPVDVILVEVTIGGVNGPICHGAGRAHKTISDYVRRVEYVDCNGDVQIVDDPYLIKAAAGAFGLLGVVTHITFELDAMTYAVMEPRKVDIGLAIPPLVKEDIPAALRSDWFSAPDVSRLLEKARTEFEHRAVNDYYSEWFWFTYQRKAWVNTWNSTSDPEGVVEYPSDAKTFLQWIEGWLGGVIINVPLFNAIPGYWQAQLLATLGMAALPPTLLESDTPKIKTALPNALHFRRGIQNMRVRDIELQIPLPPRKDDPTKPDFAIVQRAWWDIIKLVYRKAEDPVDPSTPMRLTLELRIMGGSDVLMAPQRGNNLGTASIEVLTVPDSVTDHEWRNFVQQVSDVWMSYGDELNVRPHWAKEWEGLTFHGQDAREYLKRVAYRDQIVDFKSALRRIGEPHGWGLDQLQKRFSNELWDEMIFAP